jgi:hypothetical protein
MFPQKAKDDDYFTILNIYAKESMKQKNEIKKSENDEISLNINSLLTLYVIGFSLDINFN